MTELPLVQFLGIGIVLLLQSSGEVQAFSIVTRQRHGRVNSDPCRGDIVTHSSFSRIPSSSLLGAKAEGTDKAGDDEYNGIEQEDAASEWQDETALLALDDMEDDDDLFTIDLVDEDWGGDTLDDSDEYDDSLDEACPPPLPGTTKRVFLLSDSTGTTVKGALQKALVQFDEMDCHGVRLRKTTSTPNAVARTLDELEQLLQTVDDKGNNNIDCSISSRTFTFVRSEATVASIVKTAAEYNHNSSSSSSSSSNNNALILFTMADTDLRQKTMRMCELSAVQAVDLLGPTLEALSLILNRTPKGMPQFGVNNNNHNSNSNASSSSLSQQQQQQQQRPPLSDLYYQRIEAVEYTLKADDGQAPWLLPQADIVLVGVSRTGKTPLSVVLSHTLGLKVANVPLVVECPVPQQLLANNDSTDDGSTVDPRRIFCLTVAPSELKRIRTTRLERNLGTKGDELSSKVGTTSSTYADRNYILRDLNNARELAETNGWTLVDVTGRAVEETASWIGEMMNERFNNCQD